MNSDDNTDIIKEDLKKKKEALSILLQQFMKDIEVLRERKQKTYGEN